MTSASTAPAASAPTHHRPAAAPPAGVVPPAGTAPADGTVLVDHAALVAFTAGVFRAHGLPEDRAGTAADALCHGDLTGVTSHGLTNLTRLYLPLFREGRVDPAADLEVVADRGAAVLADGHRALGLWLASEAVDVAVARAARHGVGVVSVRGSTHVGCAGYHAARAVRSGMICLLVSNCGRQRIIRPPGGRVAMLGTNPLSLAAPAAGNPPFVLDMSTTVVPTGRVRGAARAGVPVPEGWLEDERGRPVTDPAAFDRGEAYLRWLGGDPETGGYKGYGLGLLVEILGALLSGAGMGPEPAALSGDGQPSGRDDDIGVTALVLAPGALRPADEVAAGAEALFGTLLACPPLNEDQPVRYPGWYEARRADRHRRTGTPLSAGLYRELLAVAADLGLTCPPPVGDAR